MPVVPSVDFILHVLFNPLTNCFVCRGKIRCLACSLPNCLLISGNCNSFDSYRRRDHETILPDCLWASLFIESSDNGRVVSGVYFTMHCSISTPKPQFNCRTLAHRGSDSHHLCHYGVGPLCKPTKASLNLIWTPSVPFFYFFRLFGHECTWNYSLRIQRPQFSDGDSGMPLRALKWSV